MWYKFCSLVVYAYDEWKYTERHWPLPWISRLCVWLTERNVGGLVNFFSAGTSVASLQLGYGQSSTRVFVLFPGSPWQLKFWYKVNGPNSDTTTFSDTDGTMIEEYPAQSLFHTNGSGGCTTFRIRLKQSCARGAVFVKLPERVRCSPERPADELLRRSPDSSWQVTRILRVPTPIVGVTLALETRGCTSIYKRLAR